MVKGRASNIEVKRINRNRTFRYVNRFEKVSKPEIASALGVSLPTVMQNVKELTERGLIREDGEFQSTGGRKASAVRAVKNLHFAVGADITGNHISLALVNLSGEVLRHERIRIPFEDSDAYYRSFSQRVLTFRNEHIPGNGTFLGYGFSIPGIVDVRANRIRYSHVLGLRDVDCSLLSRGLADGSCYCINDANAACFAELYHEEKAGNVLYLSLSQSVGGAFYQRETPVLSLDPLGDSLYMGENNRGCEFGHMTLFPEGKTCYCGKTGCVDSYCSSRALTGDPDEKPEDFFERLDKGDPEREQLWDAYLGYLAICVNNLRMAYDCQVIIGGDIGHFIDPYMDRLREKAASRNTFEQDASYVVACRYKKESAAVGAAFVPLEEFINSI